MRIPKVLLDQAQLGDEVELEVGDAHIVIRRVARARQGWENQFELMAAQGDDLLLDTSLSHPRRLHVRGQGRADRSGSDSHRGQGPTGAKTGDA